jgi:dipeptidyl aminopeptidase/acylaminoacyl peptidase
LPRKIEVRDLLKFQLAGSVAMSPAGDRVAYVVSKIDEEKNTTTTSIYMGAPGQPAVRFTGGENDSTPTFSPDGSQLAFMSRRSGQTQIWVMSLAGGEARQLTKVQGGVGEFAWAPDGARIAFTAMLKADGIQPEVKEEKEDDLLKKNTKSVKVITELTHKADGMGYFGERRPCLCVVGLEEEAQPVQLTEPPYQVGDLAWAPDSQSLFFSGRLGADYDVAEFDSFIYRISAEGGDAQKLTPAGMGTGSPRVSPDGRLLAYSATRSAAHGYDNDALYVMDLASGETRQVAAGYDRCFTNRATNDMPAPGGASLTWAPDSASLFSLVTTGGTVQLAQIDLATDTVKELTQGDHLVYSFAVDARCRKAAFGMADPMAPSDIYWLDVKEGTVERLTTLNQALLAELELSVPTRFSAQAPDGPRVDGWIMKPAGFEAGKRYPTVLEIHGGPMMMYAATFMFEFQLLAAQGYGVVFSNPRGSQGYGGDFCAAITTEWGNKDYADLMAILDTAIAQNDWIDTDRLGVTGGSYGGFMTNWIVSHTNRFKAAVTGRSICNWSAMVGTGDFGFYWIQRFGGKAPWIDDTIYKQQSPITYVENVVTPILIEHQEFDLRCPLEQGQMWYSAIKWLGKAPTKLVTYPGEFHGMSRTGKPWHRIHRLQEITAWFAQYLNS